MYIYESRPDGWHPFWQPSKRLLNAWNAVNVDVDGVLQVGHVIGLDDTTGALPRLIIDFGYATQHSLLVEYGRVFNLCDAHRTTEEGKNAYCSIPAGDDYEDVQVLLRSHPDQPWKWHPAKVVLSGFVALSHYALVEIMVGGAHTRELLPDEQMSAPPSGEDLQRRMVRPGDFVIRTCSVPPGYWTTAEPAARDLFRQKLENVSGQGKNAGKGLRIVAVLSQTITYLQRSSESPVSEEDAAGLWNEAVQDAKPKETEITDFVEKTKRKQPLRTDEVGYLALAPEIVAEIFESMDTMERLRCRRVCHLWNEILTLEELCKPVCISLENDAYGKLPSDYAAYACVFKDITPATRTICIRDAIDDLEREDGFEHESSTTAGELIAHREGFKSIQYSH
ncbi:uncharacterized protein LOC129597205 [Paramacrobiotus metropolitanus]|uniref:uncharacterized protein LOC129597205 n=1 Tax=Paramacrobiotus metropolitanus TaxID=2943436 RepID=UPI002445AE5D|nr:uncharacterized protein LOC129597205 [Paramacrobiotus metropolitanus]